MWLVMWREKVITIFLTPKLPSWPHHMGPCGPKLCRSTHPTSPRIHASCSADEAFRIRPPHTDMHLTNRCVAQLGLRLSLAAILHSLKCKPYLPWNAFLILSRPYFYHKWWCRPNTCFWCFQVKHLTLPVVLNYFETNASTFPYQLPNARLL